MIAGLILAGGEGRRMKGTSKPEVRLGHLSLIEHVVARLALQTDRIFISGRQKYGTSLTNIPDLTADYKGPVGGLHASFQWLTRSQPEIEGVLLAPCDAPFLPATLLKYLKGESISAAHDGDRLHPTFSWWPRAGMEMALNKIEGSDVRSLHGLLELCDARIVSFKSQNAFFNINTPEDIATAERIISA